MNQGALNTRQAAAYLGCSEKAIYWWVRREGLPRRRVGSKIVYLRSELDAWLKQRPTEQTFRRNQRYMAADPSANVGKRVGRPVKPPVDKVT